MDTKTLVVGQKVYMVSGVMGCEGKVIKVSTEGVEVQSMPPFGRKRSWLFEHFDYPLHFDSNGKGRDDEGTYECGAWYIVKEKE